MPICLKSSTTAKKKKKKTFIRFPLNLKYKKIIISVSQYFKSHNFFNKFPELQKEIHVLYE